jgi:hypothetical protein
MSLSGLHIRHAEQHTIPLRNLPLNFKWDENSVAKFQSTLCRPDIALDLHNFLSTTFSEDAVGISKAAAALNNIVIKAAQQSLKCRKTKQTKVKKTKWFNADLAKLRKEVTHCGRLLALYPRDPFIRGNYFKTLKQYRRECKSEYRKFRAKITNTLDNLYDTNPKAYWNLVKQLSNKDEKNEISNPEAFYEHYKTLNKNETELTPPQQTIVNELSKLENITVFNNLDFKISNAEINKAIAKLKNEKSAGPDGIRNEMIKHGQSTLLPSVNKLFNLIMTSSQYPSGWSKGTILPLHKKGSKEDPSNFRGITLSNCLSKLFNSILNTRLTSFLEDRKALAKEQIGFKQNHRTTDHMLILRTIMEKYKKARKQLYVCFVDFRKAFDTVWHQGLLYKLINMGISSRFYNLIKNMYSRVSLSVQCGYHLTPEFPSNVGVRQGDNLSPTLFNIFINDIPNLFGAECKPAMLGDLTIPCLLYADDLVIFSESKPGMELALNNVHKYCNLWGLQVNTSKTKYMCVHDANDENTLLYGNESINKVATYTYLGIVFSDDCTFTAARNELYKKALKAYFKITKSIVPIPKPDTMLHLFDHIIKPILLYGCEVWGPIPIINKPVKPGTDERTTFFQNLKAKCPIVSKYLGKNDHAERLHVKLCKYILGVHSKTANLAVYGDLGRYPLIVDQISLSIKYFYHLEFSDRNKLLKEFYTTLKLRESALFNSGIGGFSEQIHKISNVRIANNAKYSAQTMKWIKRHINEEFLQYWGTSISTDYSKSSKNGKNKLRTYRKFKHHFKREPYLLLPDRALRKSIAQFRLSAHKLRIETDRYGARHTAVEDRTCRYCSTNQVEDEAHFLIMCEAYTSQRQALYNKISMNNIHFNNYDSDQKFFWLLVNENLEDQRSLAIFITDAMNYRKLNIT